MATYKVQRKVITWEECEVEAESFDDAIEKSYDTDYWDETYDQSEETDDYWVKNLDTDEAKMKTEKNNYKWEDGI